MTLAIYSSIDHKAVLYLGWQFSVPSVHRAIIFTYDVINDVISTSHAVHLVWYVHVESQEANDTILGICGFVPSTRQSSHLISKNQRCIESKRKHLIAQIIYISLNCTDRTSVLRQHQPQRSANKSVMYFN